LLYIVTPLATLVSSAEYPSTSDYVSFFAGYWAEDSEISQLLLYTINTFSSINVNYGY